MAHEETPHWQPIGVLPELAPMIDGMLYSAEDVSQSLQQAEDGIFCISPNKVYFSEFAFSLKMRTLFAFYSRSTAVSGGSFVP